MSKVFGVLGGDLRQVYLARSIAADGRPVFVGGLEKAPIPNTTGLVCLSAEELIDRCDVIVLPLPVTGDGRRLNAPFAEDPVFLNDGFAALCRGKTVFGGMMEKLYCTSELWDRTAAYDYYDREELAVGNAFLTAEGALSVAIQKHEGALNGSRCLVTGFGRIGKVLCLYLKSLGARVDCCARKARDLTAVRALGCRGLEYAEIADAYDVIFNTVPAPVLTAQPLSRQGEDTLLIEIASAPGGIDREAARRLNLRVVDAPSLPGKLSPRAAGELIKETVYNLLEEGR